MIKHTIQQIIDWATSFSLLERFFWFIWVLKVSLTLTLIQKTGLCPLRLLPLIIEFPICASSGYSTRKSWLGGHFFEELKNYMQNKNERNENRIILGGFNCTLDKTVRDGVKHKCFIGDLPIMSCENSSWIMGLRIFGEGIIQIPPSSSATIGPLPRIQDRQGLYWYLYWYKNC